MSSFLVSRDHIDYLVSAAYAYAADVPGIRDRTPQELGELFYRENIATVLGRSWFYDDPNSLEWPDIPLPIAWGALDDLEIDEDADEEIAEMRDECQALYESYIYEPVEVIDPGQAVAVAACWRYQRGIGDPDEMRPESWVLSELVEQRALKACPADRFIDGSEPRSFENLANRDRYSWGWSRRSRPVA